MSYIPYFSANLPINITQQQQARPMSAMPLNNRPASSVNVPNFSASQVPINTTQRENENIVNQNISSTSRSNEYSRLRQYQKDIQQQIFDFQKKFNIIESKTNTIESKTNTIESKNNTTESKVSTIESKVSTIESKTNTIESKVNSFLTKLNIIDNKSNTIEAKIKLIENKIKLIESNKNDFQTVFDNFRINLTSEITSFVSKILAKQETEFMCIQKKLLVEIDQVKKQNNILNKKVNEIENNKKRSIEETQPQNNVKRIKLVDSNSNFNISELNINENRIFTEVVSNFDKLPTIEFSEDGLFEFAFIDEKYPVIPLTKTFHNLMTNCYPEFTQYLYVKNSKNFIPYVDYIECKINVGNRKQVCKLITGKGMLKIALLLKDEGCIKNVLNMIETYDLKAYFKPLRQEN